MDRVDVVLKKVQRACVRHGMPAFVDLEFRARLVDDTPRLSSGNTAVS